MKKVKLPRRRKKRFIKELGRENYLAHRLLGEMLIGQGHRDYNPFYLYGDSPRGKTYIIKKY